MTTQADIYSIVRKQHDADKDTLFKEIFYDDFPYYKELRLSLISGESDIDSDVLNEEIPTSLISDLQNILSLFKDEERYSLMLFKVVSALYLNPQPSQGNDTTQDYIDGLGDGNVPEYYKELVGNVELLEQFIQGVMNINTPSFIALLELISINYERHIVNV